MGFLDKIFGSEKGPIPNIPCDICGRNVAKYNSWVEIRLCSNCERIFCNSCSKNLKRGRCDKCNQKTMKTQRIRNYPPNWKRTKSESEIVKIPEELPLKKDTTRFCRFCGEEIEKGLKYCTICGTKIESE
jgi:predicted amidophosphoribosyltransferase